MKLDPSAFFADPELIQVLQRRSIAIYYGADCALFHQGDTPIGLYILHQGEATLTMDSGTDEAVLTAQVVPGSLLGLPALVGNEPYTLTATAHSGAELSFISRNNFTALMQSEPLLSRKILEVLAAEVRSARNAILQRY